VTTCAGCRRLLMPRAEVADRVLEALDLITDSIAPAHLVLDRVEQMLKHVHPMIACTLCHERTENDE
jgi:hypothetical protein